MAQIAAAVIAERCRDGDHFLGYLDDDFEAQGDGTGSVLGRFNEIPQEATHFLIGIGWPQAREAVVPMVGSGLSPFVAVHPAATWEQLSTVGAGAVVGAGTVATTAVSIGSHTHIHANCVLAHDVTLGTFCTVTPGVSISGNVTIGDRVWLGVGSSVMQGVTIGDDVVVGAGAVVIDDVASGATVVGVPARPLNRST